MDAHETMRFRCSVFEYGLDAMFLTHPDGRIIAANPAACALLGRTEEDICTIGRAECVDESTPEFAAWVQQRHALGQARGDLLFIHADGHRIPVDVSSQAFTDVDGVTKTIIIARDLSTQYALADASTSAQRQLEILINSTSDFIWSVDITVDGIAHELYNNALRDHFHDEFGVQMYPGITLHELFHDEQSERLWQDLYARSARDGRFTIEYPTRGGNRWLELTLTPVTREDRVVAVSAFGRDVTAQHEARERLAASERRFRTVVETMAEGLVFQSADGSIVSANRAAERIQGRGADDLLGRTSEDPAWGAIRADGSPFPAAEHPAMRTLQTGVPESDVTMGVRLPSGDVRWISINSAPVFESSDAIPSGVVTTFRDITAQRLAEEALQTAATAFAESHEAMLVADADGTILSVNRAFSEITGYSAEEAVGQHTRLLNSGRQDRAFYQEFWRALLEEGRWQGEIWNRRKSGEIYPEWLGITAIRSEGPTRYVATFLDLSLAKQSEAQIHSLANFDMLTGLPNRKSMLERLTNAVTATRQAHATGALAVIDVDDFKSVNDARGYDDGDALLSILASRLVSTAGERAVITRLSSDEFGVILSNLDPDRLVAAQHAESMTMQLLAALAEPVQFGDFTLHCTASAGIATFRNGGPEAATLLMHADVALSEAKRMGRSELRFFDASVQSALAERVALESLLRRTVPEGLRALFQPQVGARGELIGAEALVRWEHPERGLLLPDAFIPLAEDTGLIVPIGTWMLQRACAVLREWQDNPRTAGLSVSVNVSALEMQEARFVERVLEAVRDSGCDPTKLKLELTESALLSDLEGQAEKMAHLRAAGIQFSLDDFGTGFSSLIYLKRLPLDELKIDQSFVRDVEHNANSAAIVRTIIGLGHSLGLSVIAEGVETPEQRTMLDGLGCREFQGYLIGRPMAATAILDLARLASVR